MKIKIDPTVEKFIQSLRETTVAKILRTIDLLEKFGNRLGMPHSKKVSNKLFELRIRGEQEIRIFYCFNKGLIYLIHGFIKKSQKTPQKELQNAERRRKRLTKI